jgi:hypothetical protein
VLHARNDENLPLNQKPASQTKKKKEKKKVTL